MASEPRPRRVPDDYGRLVLNRIDRSGELDVILGMLEDHADFLTEQISHRLEKPILGEAKELADLQADQGGLREVRKIAAAWRTLARAPEPAHVAGDGLTRQLADPLTRKRARARL